MKRGVIFILLILLPDVSPAQEYAAGMGRRHIYHRSGRVVGGKITDGKDICDIVWSKHKGIESITLSICEASWEEKDAVPAEVPSYFTVEHEDYPQRLVFTLSGVRAFSAEMPCIDESDLIEDMYRIMYLDDSGVRFAVTFTKFVEFEVIERHNSAKIRVYIRPISEAPVYSLRTESMRASEKLGHLEEKIHRLGGTNVCIIKSKDGYFFVEEGYYNTAEEAESKGVVFSENGIELLIERRLPLGEPIGLKDPEFSDEKLRWKLH